MDLLFLLILFSRRQLEDPLLDKCKTLQDIASGVMKRMEDREAEMQKVMTHVGFHNDANEFDEWIDEKKAAVQNVPTSAAKGNSPMEDLRLIRARIKKLQDIDSELAASEKVSIIYNISSSCSHQSSLIFS